MSNHKLDDYGQPIASSIHAARIIGRNLDELIGVCKGIVADGIVVPKEAEYLLKWIEANPLACNEWPANVIAARVCRAFQDGVIDEEEQKDLYELLTLATGCESLRDVAINATTQLPLDSPAPEIKFKDSKFCFTGKFYFGPRKRCEQEVIDLGGVISKSAGKKTDYLVIGLFGSRDWIHSTHGRKIEVAVNLKESGSQICIVSEDHWVESLVEASR